jgi:hypothetical protein
MADTLMNASAQPVPLPREGRSRHHDQHKRTLLSARACATALTPEGNDPHLMWKGGVDGLRAFLAAVPSPETDEEEEAREAFLDEEWALQGLILMTPARTLAGLKVQLAEAIHLLGDHRSSFTDERDLRCFEAALSTVELLQGRA